MKSGGDGDREIRGAWGTDVYMSANRIIIIIKNRVMGLYIFI